MPLILHPLPMLASYDAGIGRVLDTLEKNGQAQNTLVKLIQDSPFGAYELYNLADDPNETTDLAATKKQIVAELSALLRKQMQRGGMIPWQSPAKP